MNKLPMAVILDLDTFKPKELDLSPLLSLPLDWSCYDMTMAQEVAKRIEGAEVVLTNKVVLNSQNLNAAETLKYVGVLATGTNNVDHDAARMLGVKVTNVKGYGTPSVVQHTMMLMLNLATNFSAYQKQVMAGHWQSSPIFCLLDNPITELCGKHLVIVGYGELGQTLEKVAMAFGMRVSIAARPGSEVTPGRTALDELLPQADFVSLHCQLSEQSLYLMNKKRLALMKPSAFLINTARGQLVEDSALLAALRERKIAGAAVDVLSVEPPSEGNVLLDSQLDNLIVTPHNAWASRESRQRLLNIAAQNLKDYLRIQP